MPLNEVAAGRAVSATEYNALVRAVNALATANGMAGGGAGGLANGGASVDARQQLAQGFGFFLRGVVVAHRLTGDATRFLGFPGDVRYDVQIVGRQARLENVRPDFGCPVLAGARVKIEPAAIGALAWIGRHPAGDGGYENTLFLTETLRVRTC